MISILNYGMGNLASIQNMFKKVGVASRIITTDEEVKEARALVIPGVGKFDNAIKQIESMGLREVLDEAALCRNIPILGICLGMQLMTCGSEEGRLPGLGWVKANCRLINGENTGLKVPHMGWNLVSVQKQNPYFNNSIPEHRFYFVHSFSVQCDDKNDVLATTQYGDTFVSAFAVGNLLGVQFHPEKSHKFGASLLRGFATAHGLTS